MEINEELEKQNCCSPECDCGCNEGKECTCGDEECCCHEECNCGDECDCVEDSCCTEDCGCEKEKKSIFKRKDKTKELEDKVKELEDALLRSKAEFINYRKRLEEEHLKFQKYANEDIIKEILPVLDNFERAISLDDTDLTDDLSKFLSGFKMTYANFVSILEKYGIEAIDKNNEPFDANIHQAVITDHVDGVESGMVIDILQKGYILKGKVIRHAMVKVSE